MCSPPCPLLLQIQRQTFKEGGAAPHCKFYSYNSAVFNSMGNAIIKSKIGRNIFIPSYCDALAGAVLQTAL